MLAKNVLRKTLTWKSLSLLSGLCLLIAAPAVGAQDYGDQNQQQQGQQQYNNQQQGQQQGQQGQQYNSPQQGQQQQQKDFSDEKLKTFAEAKSEVDEIRSKYSQELREVSDDKKARELQEKYGEQTVESIKDKGLSIAEYNEISQAMQGDPELREKVESLSN